MSYRAWIFFCSQNKEKKNTTQNMSQQKIERHRPAKISIPDTIKPFHFKQLLQDIESTKESMYQTFVLSEVPDIDAYGEPGSVLLKQFYQLIFRLGRRPISKYLRILKQFNIDPSTKTVLLSENNKTMTDKMDSDSIAFSFCLSLSCCFLIAKPFLLMDRS